MAQLLQTGDGLTGLARYPIDDWEKQGQPMTTTKGWVKLCLKLCEKDTKSLDNIFNSAMKIEARLR
eukprot:11299727-Prorocentrum_lima.AAC.1